MFDEFPSVVGDDERTKDMWLERLSGDSLGYEGVNSYTATVWASNKSILHEACSSFMLWPIVQIIFGMLNIARCHMRSPQDLFFASGEWNSTSQHHKHLVFECFRSMKKYDQSSIFSISTSKSAMSWFCCTSGGCKNGTFLSPRGGPLWRPHRLGVQMLLELEGGLAELGPGATGMPRNASGSGRVDIGQKKTSWGINQFMLMLIYVNINGSSSCYPCSSLVYILVSVWVQQIGISLGIIANAKKKQTANICHKMGCKQQTWVFFMAKHRA